MGKKKSGKSGKNLILKVPIGTQIFEEDNNTLIEDLKKSGQKIIVAKGGKKGLGNVRFKSSINRAPRKKTDGGEGEKFWIWLQLKVIADIGIIGMPNSGKSSLLSVLTSATPKIANYPFTTINPNLGVTIYNNKEITLADIPGLIEGAHEGIGLGDKFLRHIERCKNILSVRKDPSQCFPINWHDELNNFFSTQIKILAKDEPGVLATISTTIANMETNIDSLQVSPESGSGTSDFIFGVQVKGRDHLARLLRSLRSMSLVLSAKRLHDQENRHEERLH